MLNWRDQTAVVIATGPSLTQGDCDRLVRRPGVKTIAVNLAYRVAPFADVVYMGDYLCVKNYDHEIPKAMAKWSGAPMAKEHYGWSSVRAVNGVGLGPKGTLYTGGNSGYQAIGLAYNFGVERIILLGFDMQRGLNGEGHFHPDHKRGMVQAQTFQSWLPRFEPLARDLEAAGVVVVNCTRRTALTCFRQGELENELWPSP